MELPNIEYNSKSIEQTQITKELLLKLWRDMTRSTKTNKSQNRMMGTPAGYFKSVSISAGNRHIISVECCNLFEDRLHDAVIRTDYEEQVTGSFQGVPTVKIKHEFNLTIEEAKACLLQWLQCTEDDLNFTIDKIYKYL